MSDRFLGYGRQLVEDDDIEAVNRVLRGDYLTSGSAVDDFERALAERVGARHVVAVSSGTAALHVAALAAGARPGTTGVTSTLTFVASANAFLYCGADADIVDIAPKHLGLCPLLLERRVRAGRVDFVVPVHFGGLASDAERIRVISGDAVVIEDAAHALGGTYEDGASVGSCAHADLCVFSFHPVKSITTGEGGAITTNDDELARRLRLLRSHGIERDVDRWVAPDAGGPGWYYEQQVLGFNYRMTDIQAALGSSQLAKLDRFVARRRTIAGVYDEAFAGIAAIAPLQSDPSARARSALHLYIVAVDFAALGTDRSTFVRQLHDRGIGTQLHYVPVHRQPLHRDRLDRGAEAFPAAERYYEQALSLPLHPGLTDGEVQRVIDAVAELCARA